MSVLRLIGFTGEIPRLQPRLLPEAAAQQAFNVQLTNGGLEPIRSSRLAYAFPAGTAPAADNATLYYHINRWLAWEGMVYAVPGPVASDRLYIMGDGAPRLRVGTSEYPLALKRPTAKLNASVSGTGSGTKQTRLYAYTFVTAFGEESAPSPLSSDVVWQDGQTVTLSNFQSAPSGRNITKQRIYRSQTGTSGGTQLFFIAERDATTANYTDNVSPSDIGEVIPSTYWTPPPDDLTGLIALPNGMMAAFVGKTLYFSEPYRPHAWPDTYTLTVDYDIVALGAFGTSIAVMTKGNPYIVSGTSPESMVSERLEQNLPCVNARGVVDLGYSIAYPSHDGLVTVSSGGIAIVTRNLFSREDWRMINPYVLRAGQYDGRYVACYQYADEFNNEYRGTIILDLTGEQPYLIRSDMDAQCLYYDLPSGNLYYLKAGAVMEWNATGSPNTLQLWRSKAFYLPKPGNFGAILIETGAALTREEMQAIEREAEAVRARNRERFDEPSSQGEINAYAINERAMAGDTLEPVPVINRTVSVNVYADERLVATVSTYNRMARLPGGFLARRWEIEITGDMPVEQVTLATAGAELNQTP